MIHPASVFRFVVALLLVVSLFMLTSLIWSVVDGETGTIRAFLLPVVILVPLASLYLVRTRGDFESVSTRDGFLMVSLGWLAVSLYGAIPFVLSGAIPSYVDAVFETMSGFTTTGASILTAIEPLPRSVLFWRSLTHWLGGMGIIVLTVAIFPLLGIGGMQLMRAEAPGPRVDKLTPTVTQTAKILWLTYVVLSVMETILLMFGGMNLFDALTHMFGTMATGGFSPRNASVGAYNSAYIDVVITVFMVMAGANFVLYYKAITGRLHAIFQDGELRAYLLIFGAATAIATIALRPVYGSVGSALRYGAFQVASILTTTGYATDDFAIWPPLAQIVLFALMFIGGSSGSTGGGIKVVRVVTIAKQAWNEMRYMVYPRGVFSLRMNGEQLKKDIVYAITGFVTLYSGMLLLTTILVAAAGNDILTSASTALVTLGNIGPGFGRVGPTQNFAFLPDWIKVWLTFVMMLGRLEIYTVLVLFTGRFWKQQ